MVRARSPVCGADRREVHMVMPEAGRIRSWAVPPLGPMGFALDAGGGQMPGVIKSRRHWLSCGGFPLPSCLGTGDL
ncbi:hypothetical protein Barb4_04283 [Bacteroidales bacterium Barb4]|nr:hypothetical protein Barb4_04283 [Bacteroidales bacterium Barb4]